ncbi:BRCA2, helical [Musa troglodytarum]|uniref:BRCA2, helical n=1 Tax=Musa troglodytarum TaxID=320322 RepID=A0A9E7KQ71_9LILI|nr:BRCA2, helical [Musa troglodytarum]
MPQGEGEGKSKEMAAMSKLFSGHSFGEDQELNHSGEEANQNVQSTPKRLNYHSYMNRPQSSRWSKAETKLFYEVHRPVMKNDLEVVTKIQHRGGAEIEPPSKLG